MAKRHGHNRIEKLLVCLVLALTVVSLCPNPTQAVAPANIITYQGRLLNDNGAPVADASLDMEFRLYDDLTAGTCLWSNSSAACDDSNARTVDLNDGLFSENLGDTTIAAPYAAIADTVFADNNGVFLEVEIEGETLTPRKRITAAAYAINAQTLDGLDSATLQLFEIGTNGTYEDDAATIIGADAAFSYVTGSAAGDLRIADDFEVIDDGFIGGDLVIGATSSVTETLSNTGFTIGGDDLFVAGTAGVEGNIYTDGSFIAGASSTYGDGSITDSGGDFSFNLNTGDDDLNVLIGNLKIGNGAPTTALDGEDVYVEGTFEVDGTAWFDGAVDVDGVADFSANLTNSAGELLVSGGNMQLNDAIALTFGTTDDLEMTWDDAAVAFEMDGALVSIGDDAGGTTATGDNDLFVADGFEVDGATDLDGNLTVADTDIAFDGATTTFTTTGAFTLTPGGAVILGDGGDTMVINSSDWDIDATGTITGVSFDANGTGNSITNIDSADLTIDSIDFAQMVDTMSLDAATSITGTAGEVLSLTRTLTNATAENAMTITVTASDSTSATLAQYALYIDNAAAAEGADALIYLNNSDTDDAVAAGLVLSSAAGGMTTAIDATDPEITTALNVGANDIVGSTGLINYNNFDVDATGNITVAAGVGLDANAAGALAIGNTNATSVSIANSAANDTVLIGTNADADTITIGDAANDTTTLNGLTVAIDSGDWDISATGAMTGIGTITFENGETVDNASNGNIVLTGIGGTNNTALTIDLDGVAAAVPVLRSSNNDLINIDDGLSIGVNGGTTEDISNASFSLSGGNDLYVAGDLGINGGSFFDGAISIADDIQMLFGNDNDVIIEWLNGGQDFVLNNSSVTGSTIFTLGTATAATDFQITDSAGDVKFALNGSGAATFYEDLNVTLTDGNTFSVSGDGTDTADIMAITGDSSTTGVDALYLSMTAADGTDALNSGLRIEMVSEGTAAGDSGVGILLNLTSVANVASTNAAIEIDATAEWDYDLLFGSSSPVIAVNNGGTFNFTDSALNSLLTVADGGTSVTVSPGEAGTGILGTTALEWDGIYLGDDGVGVTFGASQDAIISWVNTDSVLLIDNTNATGSTVFKLGADTTGVNFRFRNNSDSDLFTVNGIGTATVSSTGLTATSLVVHSKRNETGEIVLIGFGGATSLLPTANVQGIFLDMSTNLTLTEGAEINGTWANLPGFTSDAVGTTTITGHSITSNSALAASNGAINWTGYGVEGPDTSTTASGVISASGFKSDLGNITGTTATITHVNFEAANGNIADTGNQYGFKVSNGSIASGGNQYGLGVTTSSITTNGTQYGINISASGVAAGNLYGLNISNITDGAGNEQALVIGDDWDIGALIQSGLAFGTQTAISGATPSIKGSSHFNLTQTGGITVTGFTDGFNGQIVVVETGDALSTFDCTSNPAFNCGTGDITSADGDIFVWMLSGTTWNLLSYMDNSDNHGIGDGFDLAEYFQSNESLSAGDIVVVDMSTDSYVKKSTGQTYDNTTIGIVSTDPGLTLGDSSLSNVYPIALVGRVPVNVTNENGIVLAGDPLTTSSTPGFAMKAAKPGKIIGYALENFSDTNGQILVSVQPDWYAGSVIGTDGLNTVVSDTLVMNSLDNASATTPGVASQIFALRGSGWDGAAAQALDMKIQTEVTDTSNYRLSIKNTADSEVAYITNQGTMMLAGDMIITGHFYPSDRGTAQTSKYIYYDGSAGAGGDMMRTNAAGWSTGSYDFAEMFPSDEQLEAGDVVAFTGANEEVGRAAETYSKKIAGIVSTRPGFLAGENQANHFPVALAGRVPTKVNLENGTITVGDPLTTSSTAGYAMKATEAGQIVGYALEPYTGRENDDKITVFVNVNYSNGETIKTPGVSNTASLFSTGASANFTSLNLEGGIYMGGNDILNIGRLSGLADLWSIEESGTIKTEATIKTIITSYQNEKVETTAMTSSSGVFITLVGTTELQNGSAIVAFEEIDPAFNDVTSTTAPIRVIVTPSGPVSLYVSEKNNNGFGIRQIDGSASGVSVDWMVTAYRKDYEPVIATKETEVVIPEDIVETPEIPVETEPVVEVETETTEDDGVEEEEEEEEAEPTIAVPEVQTESAASPTQTSDPTVEGDGGTETEPPSTDSVSINSSAQTGG